MLDVLAIPFGYLMRFFYQLTQNYAIALIFFALAVKLVLLPLNVHQHRSSVNQARIRPKERAIRKRYAGRTDQAARLQMATELQQMYNDEKVSIAGGCLPMLIQLPILIILYRIVERPLTYIASLSDSVVTSVRTRIIELVKAGSLTVNGVTAETTSISQIRMTSILRENASLFSDIVPADTLLPTFKLGSVDLSAIPTVAFTLLALFPILAGVFQWLSSFVLRKLMPRQESTPETEQVERSMRMMNIMMPLISVFIAFQLPAIMALYWVYQSILGMIFQAILYKAMPIPVYSEEEYARVEEEMNQGYVPVPVSNGTSSSGHSLHRIDEDEDYYEDKTVEDDTDPDEDDEDHEPSHREESAPRVRYDKNGNPIRSLHYIDFDEEDTEGKNDFEAEDEKADGHSNETDSEE